MHGGLEVRSVPIRPCGLHGLSLASLSWARTTAPTVLLAYLVVPLRQACARALRC